MNRLLARLTQPTFLGPLLGLILANGLLWIDLWGLRYAAAFLLLAFLPGWIWLQAGFQSPVLAGERLVLAIGLSLALTILAAMFTVYWPGLLTAGQLLIATNLLSVTGLVVMILARKQPPGMALGFQFTTLLLLAILLLAAVLRFSGLGYAEFHEDEAEALMLGTRLLQGEDYALFLHRKGPAQMLLPLAFWLLTGRITEALARFPFALSSLLSVATLFFIARPWFGWQAGLVAGLLAAISGYGIAFGRMVQYQALILFLGPLAIYSLYLAWKYSQPRLQILAAILLAVCLLAHFDALLLLPAAGYLAWLSVGRAGAPSAAVSRRSSLVMTAVALVFFLGLLATFYIPYVLDPEFPNTVSYLSENRVKPGLLYNNLGLLQNLDQIYSARFYLPLLVLGITSLAVRHSLDYSPPWRWGLAGLGLLLASTVVLPPIWIAGSLSLAVVPWLVAIGLMWFAGNKTTKAAWLMFGAAFIGYVFLVDDPRTHLYVGYPGAILLAGAGWQWLWSKIRVRHTFVRYAATLLAVLGLFFAGATVIYQVLIFLQPESTLARVRQQWEPSPWETIYDNLPDARSYFGYPKREGWKVIGALRAEGAFPGDFRSVNEDFIVPIWYSFGQARSCYETPAHYFVRSAGLAEIPVPAELYTEVGRVQREGEVRLNIFSADNLVSAHQQPTTYHLEAFDERFDRLATPQQFARQGEPERRLEAQFGPAVRFRGYDLPAATVAPGETLTVNLYWQAVEKPDETYRAFVHLTDGATLWGQQDDDPVCRLPTAIWRAGQRGMGQFRLPVKPDTPPGRYPLLIGLYRADTLERLKITGGEGQTGDDFLWLGDVEVVAE